MIDYNSFTMPEWYLNNVLNMCKANFINEYYKNNGTYPTSEEVSAVVVPNEQFETFKKRCFEMYLAKTNGEVKFEDDVVLVANYAPTEPIVVEGEVKLDMGGKTITGPTFPTAYDAEGNVTETDSYGLWVKDGGEVVIDGTGVIEAQPATYSIAVWAKGGKVVIKNGTFKNGEGSDLIYASAGGQVEIYGGEFFPAFIPEGTTGTAQPYCALNLKNDGKDGSKITVYGGRFHNFNPANNKSETAEWRAANPNQFVAEGYISEEIEPNVWEVKKAEQ